MSCSACGQPACACAAGALELGGFTTVDQIFGETLVDDLTGTVDNVRDLFTSLGARQYEVTLIWTRWSGGERGVGFETVVHALQILPTPEISDLTAVSRELQAIGMEESGGIKISEISPRFDEDTLIGRAVVGPLGAPIPEDVSFYWEVAYTSAPESPSLRRRFVPKSAPNSDPTAFEWTIELLRAAGDRGRDGQPS
jgi:hypothetical protein